MNPLKPMTLDYTNTSQVINTCDALNHHSHADPANPCVVVKIEGRQHYNIVHEAHARREGYPIVYQ